ncbi:MAG: hypothetical protein EBV97_14450 [Rhodobacteraceae bacterium]|nr:hypothetical protein [Paracoccaceae bacterium]
MTNSKFLENLIAGSSAKMQEVRQHIALAAPYPVNVLAIGPTGSGKELIAKGIHKLSARTGKFIAVNTAAIPADLLEAELFGHEKGSFTGADKARKGKLFKKLGPKNRSPLISVWFARPTQILVNWQGKANSEPICSIGSRFILLKIRHWLNAPKIWKS